MFNLDVYEYFEDVNIALVNAMPTGKKVLDVGCGSGLLGEMLKTKGNTVTGIDSAAEVEELASERLHRFVLGDITDYEDIKDKLGVEQFDAVYFADVLEHIYDPVGMVKFYSQFLNEEGRLYISVPNVAIWYVRFALLFGRFRYTYTGTLDKTHVRFFTKYNLVKMLDSAGYQVEKMDINPGIFRSIVPLLKKIMFKKQTLDYDNRRALLDSRAYRIYRKFFYPIEYMVCKILPGMMAFQYVVTAKRIDDVKQS